MMDDAKREEFNLDFDLFLNLGETQNRNILKVWKVKENFMNNI